MSNTSEKVNIRHQIWIEVQLNDCPTQEALRPDFATREYTAFGGLNISQAQLMGFDNVLVNMMRSIGDDRFNLLIQYMCIGYKSFLIELKPEFCDGISTEPVELIFKLVDRTNKDESSYIDRVPVLHKIFVNGKEIGGIFEGMKIMEDIREQLAAGDYSGCKRIFQEDSFDEHEDSERENEDGEHGLTIDISIQQYRSIEDMDLYEDEALYDGVEESVNSFDDALDVVRRGLTDGGEN